MPSQYPCLHEHTKTIWTLQCIEGLQPKGPGGGRDAAGTQHWSDTGQRTVKGRLTPIPREIQLNSLHRRWLAIKVVQLCLIQRGTSCTNTARKNGARAQSASRFVRFFPALKQKADDADTGVVSERRLVYNQFFISAVKRPSLLLFGISSVCLCVDIKRT